MKLKLSISTLLFTMGTAFASSNDVKPQVIESKYDFPKTVSVLTDTLKSKGMTIFAQIDHQQAAKEAGLDMQPAIVIVYGNPKAGTPLMVKDYTLALQLPLKILVTQVDKNRVDVLFNTTEQVISHSNIEYKDVENNLAKVEKLIKTTVSK